MHDERADPAKDKAPEPPAVSSAHDDEPIPAVRQLSLDRMLYAAAGRTGAGATLRFGVDLRSPDAFERLVEHVRRNRVGDQLIAVLVDVEHRNLDVPPIHEGRDHVSRRNRGWAAIGRIQHTHVEPPDRCASGPSGLRPNPTGRLNAAQGGSGSYPSCRVRLTQ